MLHAIDPIDTADLPRRPASRTPLSHRFQRQVRKCVDTFMNVIRWNNVERLFGQVTEG
jgi:hypothetical protein